MRSNPTCLGPCVAALALAALMIGGCAGGPPTEPPPLRDMDEPLALFDEPDDEIARQALPTGGFTGVYVTDAGDSLEALIGESRGVLVDRVVENSPGDIAGLEAGDLLLAAEPAPDSQTAGAVELNWSSQWRRLELSRAPGDAMRVLYDRAGVERRATLDVAARLRSPDRHTVERYREESRVGVVVRTATEVEARAADLGPGGGAVIVGLSRASPWRDAGLQYGDVIAAIDGQRVDHPQVVLDSVRAAEPETPLEITFVRDDVTAVVQAPVTRRETETTLIDIPLLYKYERDRDREEVSVVLGIYNKVTTPAAWHVRILWILNFSGGDADRLREVGHDADDADDAADASNAVDEEVRP